MTWDEIVLYSLSDVESEHGNLTQLVPSKEKFQSIIEDIRVSIKKDLGMWLTRDVPDILVRRTGYYEPVEVYLTDYGYSYDQLDTLLDVIGNPEVLYRTALKGVVYYLWKRRLASGAFSAEAASDIEMKQVEKLKAEYEKQYQDEVYVQIWFDLDGDEQVTDNERLRSHNSFWRS